MPIFGFGRLVLLATCILLLPMFVSGDEARVALVIGCDSYENTRKLENARADAKAIATLLKDVDFEVIELLDPSVEEVYEALEEFKKLAARAEVGLFYFAGHGIEVDGENYLIPVEAALQSSAQLRTQAIGLTTVLEDMDVPGLPARMLILDCCRDNPLSRSWMNTRSASSGLALIKDSQIPPSTMLMFAAAPGQPALDGEGRHSPFTNALLNNLTKPKVSAFDAFLSVSDSVASVTGERQVPWIKFDGAGRAFRFFDFNEEGGEDLPSPSRPVLESYDGQFIPGVRFGSLELGSSPLEVSRAFGVPTEAKSYRDGETIIYRYPERGIECEFLHGRLFIIFVFSGKHTERGRAGNTDIQRYEKKIVHPKGEITWDQRFSDIYEMFGEPKSGRRPDLADSSSGNLSYEDMSFSFLSDGSFLYATVFASDREQLKWWEEHILSSPERAEQSRKLSSLFEIKGLVPGDTLTDVVRKWGEPDAGTVESQNLNYFGAENLYCCRIFGFDITKRGFEPTIFKQIFQFRVSTQKAADALSEGNGSGKWFSFYGKNRKEIEESLGNPSSSDRGCLIYHFHNGEYLGNVAFQCYDFEDSNCTEIVVQWDYKRSD